VKKLFFIILCLIAFSLFSQDIGQITSISYNRLLLESSLYQGTTARYENRLFVNCSYKIFEYLILDSGRLEQISSMETGLIFTPSLVHETRLYSFYSMFNKQYLLIHDLTSIPMTLLTTVEIPTTNQTEIKNAEMIGDYLYIYNWNGNYIKFNKRTLTFEGQINLASLYSFTTTDSLLISPYRIYAENNLIDWGIRFYNTSLSDENNPIGIPFLSFPLGVGYTSFRSIYTKDNYLIIIFDSMLVLYDLHDRDFISQIAVIPGYFIDAAYYENYLILCPDHGFLVLDITDPVFPQDVFHIPLAMPNLLQNNLLVYNGILYINEFHHFSVYDLRNNFQKIGQYGISTWDIISNYMTKPGPYFILKYWETPLLEISNIHDSQQPIITIDTQIVESWILGYEIRDNLMYTVDFGSVFSIYDLDQASLLYRFTIPYFSATSVRFFDNYVILGDRRTGLVGEQRIYHFSEIGLQQIGFFYGDLGRVHGYDPEDYFFSQNNTTIEFRNKANPLEVLYSSPLFHSTMYDLEFVARNTLAYKVAVSDQKFFTYYQDEFQNFNETFSFTERATFYQELMTTLGGANDNLTNFYVIFEGYPWLVGEFDAIQVEHSAWVYCDQRQILIMTNSSHHLFNFEYSLTEQGLQTLAPLQSQLYGNYPNPFNPETTINYSLENKNVVNLAIYNIKGQKIRTLLDNYVLPGKHHIIWNGKDENNHEVASGIYFIQMKVEGNVNTHKMLLIK